MCKIDVDILNVNNQTNITIVDFSVIRIKDYNLLYQVVTFFSKYIIRVLSVL